MFTFFTVLCIPNQIGCRFWDLALREHASTNKVTVTAILPLLDFKPQVMESNVVYNELFWEYSIFTVSDTYI